MEKNPMEKKPRARTSVSPRRRAAQSEFARRPHSLVALLALCGTLASGVLLVLLLLFWPTSSSSPSAGAGHTTPSTAAWRMWGVNVSLATFLVAGLLFLVWYLSPHLVHRVPALRPLNSAVAPGTTVAAREQRARKTPPLARWGVRMLLTLLLVAPLLAAALLIPTPMTLERFTAARVLDTIVVLCAMGGMGYLIWRWLHVRAHQTR
jgi:small-conductance mechanosensitive channel